MDGWEDEYVASSKVFIYLFIYLFIYALLNVSTVDRDSLLQSRCSGVR